MFDLTPFDGLVDAAPDIRAARQGDTLLIYVPFNIELTLRFAAEIDGIKVIDLENNRGAALDYQRSGERLLLSMHAFTGDCLYVVTGR